MASTLAPGKFAVDAYHGEREPQPAEGRVVVPMLEAAVMPGVDTGDDVGRFVVGEGLRPDEPKGLQGERRQQDKGNCRVRGQVAAAGQEGLQ